MVSIHGVTEHVKKLGNKIEQNFPLGKFGPYKIAISACRDNFGAQILLAENFV